MDKFANLIDHELDSYIATNLLVAPTQELADEFLAVAKRLCEIRSKSSYWNHSVCHFIEKYGEESGRAFPSLLTFLGLPNADEFPQYRAALDMLVASAFPDTNCLDRIMCPILNFNLREAKKHPEATTFAYYNPVFRDAANLAVAEKFFIRTQYSDMRGVYLMMASDGPAELWQKALASSVPLFPSYYLEDYASLHCTNAQLAAYLQAAYGNELKHRTDGLDIGTLVENLRTPFAGEALPGVYVDVDGTLLFHQDGKDSLSEHLHSLLVAGSNRMPVTIFSGGDPVVQTRRLAAAGCDARLLPVKSKAEFRGKRFHVIIDDTKPAISGFCAERWVYPSNRQGIEQVLGAA